MIQYEAGKWNIAFIWTLRGSVFQKSLVWAVPNGVFAAILSATWLKNIDSENSEGISQLWSVYNFALAFLIVFRSQQAYSRFTEGASDLQRVRGHWFNVASNLIAFTAIHKPELKEKVWEFQNLIVRLVSMLHCAALRQVANIDAEDFEIIENAGLDRHKLMFLARQPEKCEILMQWVQRAAVDAVGSGVVCAPPPIVSRVFQELANGQVSLDSAKKINEIPFPFPYAQMTTVMLLMQWLIAPFVCGLTMVSPILAGVSSFIAVCAFWSINYVASEIEMPFGEDLNDLPIADMQKNMNQSLLALLLPDTQQPPRYRETQDKEKVGSTRTWASIRVVEQDDTPLLVSEVGIMDDATVALNPDLSPVRLASPACAEPSPPAQDAGSKPMPAPSIDALPPPPPVKALATPGAHGASWPERAEEKQDIRSAWTLGPGAVLLDTQSVELHLQRFGHRIEQQLAQIQRRLDPTQADGGVSRGLPTASAVLPLTTAVAPRPPQDAPLLERPGGTSVGLSATAAR